MLKMNVSKSKISKGKAKEDLSEVKTKRMKLDVIEDDSNDTDHDVSSEESEDPDSENMVADNNFSEGGFSQEDYDDEEDDEVIEQTPKLSGDEYNFEVITTEDILKTMKHMIDEACTLLDVSPSKMRLLLHHFKWDKEKLLEKYYEGDQDKIFEDAHIQPGPSRAGSIVKSKSETILQDCNICFIESKVSKMFGLGCNHKFCSDCWSTYLKSKIMSDGVSYISCPQPSCDLLIDDSSLGKFVSDPTVQAMYHHLQAKDFIESNRVMKWCTSPTGCTNALRVEYIASRPVICSCGHVFCFECGHAWHDPIKCNLLKKWIKKCADDSETSRWIQANTKDCPKCHVQIEKNGGCNHMTCRSESCSFEWCWLCGGKWPHTSGGCNRYDAEKAKGQEQSRAALQRYLFYCDRYMNHMKSLKFEHKLYETVQGKMDSLQKSKMSWIEVQFLKKAVQTLCQCRQTLMYTYSFAFYLEKTNQCIMFETNQGDLETSTEDLSEILEKDIPDDSIEFKRAVQDKLGYCETRRQVLIDHVYEGYSKDWWKFIDP